MKRIGVLVFFILSALAAPLQAATTQLPNGMSCFSATTGINGMVGVLGAITGGSGYVTGTYPNVPLIYVTSGTGTLATATITVSGGVITGVIVVNPGKNYVVGDVLTAASANLGGAGSGFSIPVNSISINSSLAGGSVNMWVPLTTTPKNTWQDAGQVTLNSNPIILDANGCAVIYGTGEYRQQLLDSLGNLVWDRVTWDTSAYNSVFWAGTAGGSANVITVTDAGFNGTDGSVINFTALTTNTGATTLNPSGFGAIPILKNTTGGSVALSGSEIIAGNVISALYKAATNAFYLLNTAIQSVSGAQAPLCGASGLKIINGTSPGATINVTANTMVMVSASGLIQTRGSFTQVLNIASGNTLPSVAGGMDGEAPGTSAWIDIFAIDNGAAPSVLGSLAVGNGLAPVLPSGYPYKCYMGAMYVNSSGVLLGSIQLGNRAQYVIGGSGLATSNIALLMASGNSSGYSITSPTGTAVPVGSFVPPTATQITLNATGNWKGGGSGILVAPNASWFGTANDGPNGTLGAVWPCWMTAVSDVSMQCTMLLESTSIYWSGGGTGSAITAFGWVDAVNAN